jgi:hypothetical protein
MSIVLPLRRTISSSLASLAQRRFSDSSVTVKPKRQRTFDPSLRCGLVLCSIVVVAYSMRQQTPTLMPHPIMPSTPGSLCRLWEVILRGAEEGDAVEALRHLDNIDKGSPGVVYPHNWFLCGIINALVRCVSVLVRQAGAMVIPLSQLIPRRPMYYATSLQLSIAATGPPPVPAGRSIRRPCSCHACLPCPPVTTCPRRKAWWL